MLAMTIVAHLILLMSVRLCLFFFQFSMYLLYYLYLFPDSAIVYVECLLKTYATTIAITGGNLLLPFLFSYLTHFEEYDPKTQLMIDLVRNIVIRLSGLMVIIGGHINSNKSVPPRVYL